jgi:hypothetical protein
MDAATQGEEATARNSLCLKAGYSYATLYLIDRTEPKALHRSYVADLGISTPKQMAKRLVQFSASHPELRISRSPAARPYTA